MKKIYAVIISAAMFLSFCLGIGASNGLEEITALLNRGITIKMDGQAQEMYDANGQRVYPISYNGTTYLPVRAVGNMMGLGVDWDAASNSVLLSSGGATTNTVITPGIAANSYYENTYIGIGFNLPDGWMFATDEEIDASMGVGMALVNDDVANLLETAGAYCDMMASNGAGDSVALMIEKKNAAAKAADFDVVFEASAELARQQFSSIYQDFGMTERTVHIGAKSYRGYDIDGSIYGMKLYQSTILIDLGDYVASIAVNSIQGRAEAEAIWSYFFAL